MIKSKHKHLDGQITAMYVSGQTMGQVALALELARSTVAYRIKCLGLSRSISETLAGVPKSESHKRSLSETRILSGVAKGSKNPNWKGGITTETEKKIAAMKRDPRYKAWRTAVLSVRYCESCGSTNRLEAHHVLPKAKFPHLIHDINNGKCLCHLCHKLVHGAKCKSDELLETLTVNDEGNQQPSVQSTKVQRLLEHSDMLNNQDTVSDTKSEDIVYTDSNIGGSVLRSGPRLILGSVKSDELLERLPSNVGVNQQPSWGISSEGSETTGDSWTSLNNQDAASDR